MPAIYSTLLITTLDLLHEFKLYYNQFSSEE